MADPTRDELAAFESLHKVFNWCGIGSDTDLACSVKGALGDPRFIQDVVHIARLDWDSIIKTIKAASKVYHLECPS